MKLLEQVRQLKEAGYTEEQIAEELDKPLFLIRALYRLVG